MDSTNKFATFVGFAVRTGRFKTGVNAVATLKRADLILISADTGESTLKEGIKLAKRFKCPVYKTVRPLEELTHKDNAKVMAVFDKKLAKAIVENGEGEMTQLSVVKENVNG